MNFLKMPTGILTQICDAIVHDQWIVGGAGMFTTWGLYIANHTPQDSDTYATYAAIEATFGGYVRQGVAAAAWSASTLIGLQAVTLATPLLWVPTGAPLPQTVYGYFVQDHLGSLIWAQLFDAPYVLNTIADFVLFTPSWSFASAH